MAATIEQPGAAGEHYLNWPAIRPVRAWPRPLPSAAVVVLHGLLILLIVKSNQRAPEDAGPISVWLDVRPMQRVDDLPSPPETERRPVETSARSDPSSRLAPSESSAPRTSESTRVPDWYASAKLAASAAVRRAIEEQGQRERYRNFGPRKVPEPPPKEPSIFETPRHRLGDVGEDALGYKSVWLGDKCYVALEEPMSFVGRLPMILNATMCVYPIGKKPARGDLFDGMYTNEETER